MTLEDKILARSDWYLSIGYNKALEDIITSLSALRIILYNKTNNHKKYVEATDKAFEIAAMIAEGYIDG